jgi:Fe-S-cluster formation regulator IscX/YfhJ
MSENKKKILEMLAEKKITADEAYRLLSLVEPEGGAGESVEKPETGGKDKPKYLRVTVLPSPDSEKSGNFDRVNVRVPMSLIRAGIKLTSLIPNDAAKKVNIALKDKGIDFDLRSVKTEDIEQLIEALGDMEVDVETGREKVRVFVE